ncbi:MAG: 1-acylglycerol-3-phosphate O-acyltransferase, partial [Nitrospiria bacterium]
FERDLGLGSLERVELLIRIESHFSVTLPDTAIADAATPAALADIVLNAGPSQKRSLGARAKLPKNRAATMTHPVRTLSEALIHHAEADPERPHIYLTTDHGTEETLSYQDLLSGATAIANGLRDKGLSRGETVSIMLPTGRTFFDTFFGVLLAGGVPVPIYPPFKPNQIEAYAARQENILKNAEAAYLITFQRVETVARLLRPRLSGLRAVLTPENLSAGGQGETSPPVLAAETDPALIQYTSGSTGNPKGVYLTHENLLANIRCMKKAMHISSADIGVSWLPLYHDMGLIGSWLFCLTHGIPISIMSPMTFLSRPEKWLWAIHRYGGTLSAAPNFAYEICATKLRDEVLQGLDLSSWRIALNGAEQISPETLKRFSARFAPYGFRPETHLPVYGMAEASVGLAFPPLERAPRIDRVSRTRFQKDGEAFPAKPAEASPLAFVSCGLPLPEHEIRIVNESGAVLGERMEGHIEFRGPSCTSGYYRNLEKTASLFRGDWLVSGDLGYIADGELFITGRKKDVIIKGGRNLHPHEIEGVTAEVPGVRKGCIAAFGIPDKGLGTEKLVVVAETRSKTEAEQTALKADIHQRIFDEIGLPADVVCLVPPGAVLKTSSGKIARSACRAAYLKGELTKRPRRVSMQFTRLFAAWLKSWGTRFFSRLARLCYAAYLIFILSALIMPAWLLVLVSPAKRTGYLLKTGARLFLKLAGASPTVRGEENIKGAEKTPVVWVANHASYLDVVFLISSLPEGVHFVAKRELLKVPFLKTFLRKGGHVTVDRQNIAAGTSVAEEITALLKGGASVLIFPEGTFRPTAGLRPFKLGAFQAAVETGFPVIPIALKGTREFLRDRTWLPKWTPVSLNYCVPTTPKGEGWREIVRLRESARKAIAAHVEEVILA